MRYLTRPQLVSLISRAYLSCDRHLCNNAYLHYKRPGITESGNALTRLKLDAAKANSLQASLGVALRHQWQPSAGKRLSSEFAVTWEQALLGSTQSQYAAFAALMLPLFCGVLSSLLTRPFCAVPRTSVARIAWG